MPTMIFLSGMPIMLALSGSLHMRRFVDVESPAAYASPEAAVLTRLFANLVTDYLNELAYPADLAGAFALGCCWSSSVLRPCDGAVGTITRDLRFHIRAAAASTR